MNKKVTREQMIEEANERLAMLRKMGMKYAPAVDDFKTSKEIGIFENQGRFANAVYYRLYINTGDNGFYDDLANEVKEFEKEYEAVVYLILVSHTEMGTLCDMFYVGQDKSNWNRDRQDLEEGLSFVYDYNRENPAYSELGTIGFKVSPCFGGLFRVA